MEPDAFAELADVEAGRRGTQLVDDRRPAFVCQRLVKRSLFLLGGCHGVSPRSLVLAISIACSARLQMRSSPQQSSGSARRRLASFLR
jgi:hypothetical protein